MRFKLLRFNLASFRLDRTISQRRFSNTEAAGLCYSFIWDLKNTGLREVMRLLGPNAIAIGISSTGAIVGTAFASSFPDKASLAALHNAQMLFALPVILLAKEALEVEVEIQ